MRGFGEIAEKLRRSTVQIEVPRARAGGSGVVWNGEGAVITNAHVIRSYGVFVRTWDNRRLPASLVASDARKDLAWLRTEAGLEPARFRDSCGVRSGELVMAIGSPLGFSGALSTGVVRAVGPLEGFGRRRWIQAGVRLLPGNSGGPLADAQGQVIGINTMVTGGLGLAIPAEAVAAFVRSGGNAPRLGVVVRPVALRRAGRFTGGLLVLGLECGGPADNASLLPGDVLVGADGLPFELPDDPGEALESSTGVVRLQFLRGERGVVREAAVRIADRAAEAA